MLLGIHTPTPEGLVVEELPAGDGWTVVREVGKLGYVVFEYRCCEEDIGEDIGQTIDNADITFLLERVAELEKLCGRLRQERPTSIELPQHKWNLKKARQRFRRWYQEHDVLNLDVRTELRPLVISILNAGGDQPSDPTGDPDFLIRAYETGDIGVLENYVRRKLDRPPLILSRIPQEIASLLRDANEAYRFGLFRAVAALCRATLEKTLRMILEVGLDGLAVPIDRDDLKILINSLPDRFLRKAGRDFAHEIRLGANEVLHHGKELSEDEAWALLVRTARIVDALLNRSRSLKGT
ncbi:MAG: hypothetical protein ABSA52_16315 [Candidatus Binatia bacterium]|jgi:hypothetical protein